MRNRRFNYIDITEVLLKKAKPNNDTIAEISKYKRYNVKNAVFDTKDISYLERKPTKIIQSTLGGNFKLIHRIQNKSTPDCEYKNKLLFKNKRYFEIKSPKKSKTINSRNQKISRQLNEAKYQSKNVILSLLRKECDLTNKEATEQLLKCLNSKQYNWINSVILIGKGNYIKVYKKKRP